ncbi:polyamine ABC transporter ATP-binding protein (plasmid) [Agrobacterium tumefaciens]|uniref:Spermidine/putrescine import ATP-binding protein PotA n=3 Tax=Rhizobiaceae TaxID=82115 RepID=A0A2Z2PNX3_AGRTU|nr:MULTISPECIES: polyamine ABC transporter ATP-binding protein [Rhizobium/Agrobacterium group]ASK40990.1 polyamine ABC transporter ATP-binding protein [Rhizobium rhizogenes]ASK41160.1 polyamine ABC transporter ATP-binding protein [Agrobacterium tumefaciens]ASK41796.1 polyamine ABC transporter ATP-binding protein [Agrobacterium tumefaciens]MDJ1637375.1 polyamine ABC transporter ATP-binding protein [Rhizobium rhizogenes]MDR5010947.1 polyamine ABC transporter ATP-binding protein [Agrobacterium tu
MQTKSESTNDRLQPSSLPITVAGVTKSYGALQVLSDINLHIKSGEFLTLLGPSGSGKTTLLMTLAGFIRPDLGSLKFGEEEVVLKAPHLRRVGMMFQNYALFPHMSVEANIGYPLKIRGEDRATIKSKVQGVLETVQLGGYGHRKISELSGGQRQRIALARAIVFKPKILLMDEPLSALDKNLRELMQLELRNMHEQLGMTTVLVTHDQREALTMSDRIAVLRNGKIAQVDTSETLYSEPNSEFVASFMGESSFLALDHDGTSFSFHGKQIVAPTANKEGVARHLLVLRPEKLDFIRDEDRSSYNSFDGTVEKILFQGESCLIQVKLTTGDLIQVRRNLRESNRSILPHVNDQIILGLHPSETRIVAGE